MDYKNVIVAGAGLWGCSIARRLAESGKHVTLMDRRTDIGGNCRCISVNGIEVHEYGSHVFHTSDENVWAFVNRFAKFNPYEHHVLANVNGKTYHLPIGRTLIREFIGRDAGFSELSENEKKKIFDTFIRGYTSKQWGVKPEDVDPSVISRLKVRDGESIDYFDDKYEGIPIDGYNKMFENMVDHPNIEFLPETEFVLDDEHGSFDKTNSFQNIVKYRWDRITPAFYSGSIDRLFSYRHGALPWRSLRFETSCLPVDDFQHAATVNYPDASITYTRIHEFRHFHTEKEGTFSHPSGTIVTKEYPEDWKIGDEPYYPVNNETSEALLCWYREDARELGNIVIGGRLGLYMYLDMDDAVKAALCTDI